MRHSHSTKSMLTITLKTVTPSKLQPTCYWVSGSARNSPVKASRW